MIHFNQFVAMNILSKRNDNNKKVLGPTAPWQIHSKLLLIICSLSLAVKEFFTVDFTPPLKSVNEYAVSLIKNWESDTDSET